MISCCQGNDSFLAFQPMATFFSPKMSTAPLFFSVPTPYPVKSSVLRWRLVLSRFYPRVQQSHKNIRENRVLLIVYEQSAMRPYY